MAMGAALGDTQSEAAFATDYGQVAVKKVYNVVMMNVKKGSREEDLIVSEGSSLRNSIYWFQFSKLVLDEDIFISGNMLSSAIEAIANTSHAALTQASAISEKVEPIFLQDKSVVQITMMDPEISKYRMNGSLADINECIQREDYSSLYMTLLICLVTIGLTASLFVLTVIGWFPDLYSTSKYIGQAYSLFTNMVALVVSGFVVLSTFVPSIQACNMVVVLVHFTMFLFLTSEFLVHLDFYTAIVLPFWHEEKVASNENAATFLCVLSIIGSMSATGGLFFSGHIKCEDDHSCPIVPIINMSLDESTSMTVVVMTLSLLGFVFLTCCHIFLIALQKLRANVVAPAAANNLSGTTKTILVDNGEGVLVYDDDVVSKEVRSAARTPFADPNFLQAIGSSFLERVAKNNERHDEDPDLPGYEDEPRPSTSRDADNALLRSKIRYEKENAQIVLKPPTTDEANKSFDKFKAETTAKESANAANKDEKEKEEAPPINLNVELWKALTKSFRFTILTIVSYGFLLLPSMGLALLGMGYHEYVNQEYAEDPTNLVFLKTFWWRFTMLLFVLVRTAQPIILAKMDKTINNKIGVIISDDVED